MIQRNSSSAPPVPPSKLTPPWQAPPYRVRICSPALLIAHPGRPRYLPRPRAHPGPPRARASHHARKVRPYVELIRKHGSRIDLEVVPADTRGDRATFSSSPSTTGALLFTYHTPSTYHSTTPLTFLHEFQLHRRIHGIIGILDCAEYSSPSSSLGAALEQFQSSLKTGLPKSFCTKVYGFEPEEEQLLQARGLKEEEGLVMIPKMNDVGFFLNTVLADFASGVLWEFSNLAAQLESRTSIPTPQEPVPSLPPSQLSTTAPSASRPSPTRASSLSTIPSSPTDSAQPTSTALNSNPNQDVFVYGMNLQSNVALQGRGMTSSPTGTSIAMSQFDPKARKRVLGREKKLLGDLWLLAGRVGDAIACYNESILLTKSWSDSVWQASALEGLCVALVLQANATLSFSSQTIPSNARSSTPISALSPPEISTLLSLIPEKLSLAVSLYEKLLPSLSPSSTSAYATLADPDRAHPLVYAEACLRCAKFLMAVWGQGGSVASALNVLTSPASTPSLAMDVQRLSLSPSNTVPRSSIALWASTAYSPQLRSLGVQVRLGVLGSIAGVFGRIGYRRKEAFVLREMAALCAVGVAGREVSVVRVERGEGERVAVGLGLELREEGRDLEMGKESRREGEGESIVRTETASIGNESVVKLVEKVCCAFGIGGLVKGRDGAEEEGRGKRFGWPFLQRGVLGDAIRIAEVLPDYQSAIRFTVTALRNLSDSLPSSEQLRLSQSIPRLAAAATRRGASVDAAYWGPKELLMSLEVAPLSPNRIPHEHPLDEVEVDSKTGRAKDAFIYNHGGGGRGAQKRERPTLVERESVEVFVTLVNPFAFELEVMSLELYTSGIPFSPDPLSVTLPPSSFHTVRLSGTPLATGTLTIRGCNIRLSGCPLREFVVPIWDEKEDTKKAKELVLDTSADRIKATGLAAFARMGMADGKEKRSGKGKAKEEETKFLVCRVVPPMPTLWMKSNSLTHGALMLYDGETTTIRIGLENTSTLPVDFVKLTFSDMHSAATQAYIAEKEVSPGDVFEIESDNLNRPVFTWSKPKEMTIKPEASVTLEVKCLGKIGCGWGTIQIDYATISPPLSPPLTSAVVFTRQIFLDVFTTVHKTLFAHSLDILRLKALPGQNSKTTHTRSDSVLLLDRRGVVVDKGFEDSLRMVKNGKHCLVAVDLGNSFGAPFEVAFGLVGEPSSARQRQRLEPGATTRLLLRVDRFVLAEDIVSQPIPSLSQRQFILAKVKHSADEDKLNRELFWYREELLKKIHVSWNEVGTLRTGSVSLRGLRLTKPMLDVLRGDEVDVSLSLEPNSAASPGAFTRGSRDRSGTYSTAANEFVDVVIKVTNKSQTPLDGTLQLKLNPPDLTSSSVALAHLSRYILVDGPGFSPIPLPILGYGEEETLRMSICLLAEGMFELGCVIEGMGGRFYRAADEVRIKVDS